MLVLFILDIFTLIILGLSSIILYKELKKLKMMKRNIEKEYENSNKK